MYKTGRVIEREGVREREGAVCGGVRVEDNREEECAQGVGGSLSNASMLLLWLLGMAEARPLVDPVGLELVVDEVVLGLAALAADVALGPGLGWRPIRVDVLDVLA